MPLNAQISLSIIAHESTSGDISRQMRVTPAVYAAMLTDGTGANQAQVVWSEASSVTEASGVAFVFDSLQDDRGTVSFSSLKAIYVRNSGPSPLLIATENWTDAPIGGPFILQPGSAFTFVNPSASGWPITEGATVGMDNAAVDTTTVEVVFIGEGTIT